MELNARGYAAALVGRRWALLLALVTAVLAQTLLAQAKSLDSQAPRPGPRLSTPGCDSQFHVVPAPAGSGAVASMTAVSATDIWAVGNQSAGAISPTVEHWDGSSWNLVPAPFQGVLSGVTASAGDPLSVWAVGWARADAIVARWNGSAWDVHDVGAGVLRAATEISATNIWAVGSRGAPPNALVEHYDGAAWSEVIGANMPNDLVGVSASSPTDVWAAGYTLNGTAQYPTFAHWNGNQLSGVVSGGVASQVNGVAALSPTAAWAVGHRSYLPGGRAVVEQWDGRTWTGALDQSVGSGASLSAITAIAPSNVWTAGWFVADAQTGSRDTLIGHWDGGTWKLIPGANADAGTYFKQTNELSSIVAISPTNIWAAGAHGQFSEQALFENLCIGPPTVSGVTPLTGNANRGTQVRISGAGFNYAIGVNFGGTPAASFTVDSDSQITAVAPSEAAGPVDVTVTSYGGTSATSVADLFVFVPPAVSWQQYELSGSDGVTWQPVDRNALSLLITPSVDSNAVLSANADLWTAGAGVNQDLGITVSGGGYGAGEVVAWKEAGGAATFSPHPVTVQAVAALKAGISYTVTLDWKTNHPTGASIFVGAGGSAPFSPTRLSAQLVGTNDQSLQTAASTQQYTLTGSDGNTWIDMVSGTSGLIVLFTPAAPGSALISVNADLWSQNLGVNQDIGIRITGGAFGYSGGQLVAWRESGGVGSTFSPNPALLQTQVLVDKGVTYSVKVQWKSNHATDGTIRAGAGLGPDFSPTRITALVSPGPQVVEIGPSDQFSRDANGTDWRAIDVRLVLTINTARDSYYRVTVNADLWTDTPGVNQDLGIAISGGLYGSGVLITWKESGGFGGTFSPNPAFVETILPLAGGTTYAATPVWKPNHSSAGKIYAGAGPIGQSFSPVRLTTQALS